MANNLAAVTPKLLAQGLLALREMAIMPMLVNRSYEPLAGQKGSTIDVPIPSAIAAADVTPAATPPSTADVVPTSVAVTLSNWKEAVFYLTDKDVMEAMNGSIPMQASAAIKALAAAVTSSILAQYTGVYGFYGTPGTTPFGNFSSPTVQDAVRVRETLFKQLCPDGDRRMLLDPTAEAAALMNQAFQNAQFGGGASVILEGKILRKLGFDWFMDQLVPTHTRGTISDGTNPAALVNGALTAGVKTMNIDSTTLTGTLVTGDVFTFAGHSQTYVVTNGTLTASGNAIAGVQFEPALAVGVADNTAITFKGTHVVNLAFHRDAFAFATRPLETVGQGLGSLIQSAVDPQTGLTLRLEISREHKRTRFSYDILWGVKLVRAELACRLAG